MLRRAGNIITLITVVALLLLNGTAHEFVHSFAAHEDTIDTPHSHVPGKTFFEKEHHHCDFLDLALVVFDHITPGFNFTFSQTHTAYYASYKEAVACTRIFSRSDRGPPDAQILS